MSQMQSWPECPVCHQRRTAVCRFCGTQGDDFPLADTAYITAEANTELKDAPGDPEMEPVIGGGVMIQSFLQTRYGADPIRLTVEKGPGSVNEECSRLDSENEGNKCGCHESHGNDPSSDISEVSVPRHDIRMSLSNPLDKPEDFAPDEENIHPLAVLCPGCDELIRPKFLKKCVCGYEFPDGISELRHSSEVEKNAHKQENTGRIFMVVGIIVFFGLALLGAFFMAGR